MSAANTRRRRRRPAGALDLARSVLVASAGALLVSGCQVSSAPVIQPAAGSGSPTDAAQQTDGVEEPGPFGTRERPLPVGAPIQVGDWSVTVEAVVEDAAPIVAEHSGFNDPPGEDRQFVLWRATVTYLGEGSVVPGGTLMWALVGSQGNSFGTFGSDTCGTIPNSLTGQGEMTAGSTVTGNLCTSAAIDQVDGATISVQATDSADQERVFVALP